MSAPIALVNGGTSGIGKATAKVPASKGATVILSGRRATEGARVVEEIRATGGEPDVAPLLIDGTLADFGLPHRVSSEAARCTDSRRCL